jgi:hypothetical protein
MSPYFVRRVEVLGANEIVQKMNEIGHRLQ